MPEREKKILYKGGSCLHCGIEYNGFNGCIFDFHHRNPAEKTKNLNGSFKDDQEELDKTIMLCSNCHRLLHHTDKDLKEAIKTKFLNTKKEGNLSRTNKNEKILCDYIDAITGTEPTFIKRG